MPWHSGSCDNVFLSTPSVRRATSDTGIRGRRKNISIHALRAEGDFHADAGAICLQISIHALRAEGDGPGKVELVAPVRISIHALRAEGDPRLCVVGLGQFISIHALRAEGDTR